MPSAKLYVRALPGGAPFTPPSGPAASAAWGFAFSTDGIRAVSPVKIRAEAPIIEAIATERVTAEAPVIEGTASERITLTAPTIELKGNVVQSDGNITATGSYTGGGDVVGNGISLHDHVHGGVSSGGSNTGPPA